MIQRKTLNSNGHFMLFTRFIWWVFSHFFSQVRQTSNQVKKKKKQIHTSFPSLSLSLFLLRSTGIIVKPVLVAFACYLLLGGATGIAIIDSIINVRSLISLFFKPILCFFLHPLILCVCVEVLLMIKTFVCDFPVNNVHFPYILGQILWRKQPFFLFLKKSSNNYFETIQV